MEASSSSFGKSAAEWSDNLKNAKSKTREMGVGISKIYYDRSNKELVLFKAKISATRYKKISLDDLRSRTITVLSSTEDVNVKYRAIKSLLKLMSAKPMNPSALQELTQVSMQALQGLSPEKAQKIRELLESAKRSIPSEQGGTGVHFLEVSAPSSTKPHVRVPFGIYKFVPNPRQVLFANSVLKHLGFIVPKTRMILRESPEGERALELFRASCPDRTVPLKGHILMMDRMQAQPFNRMIKEELIDQLHNPLLVRDLGRMVLIDLCIGNIDRWNQARCAPGNMMLAREENKSALVLIDHESRLESMETTQIQEQIELLLKGNAAQQLFEVMNTSLHHEWTKRGEAADQRQVPPFSHLEHFQQGLLEGAKQLCALFPHQEALEAFAARNLLSPDNIDTKKLWIIIQLLRKMN